MTAVQRQSTRSEHEASTLRLRSDRSARDARLVEEIKRTWREGSAVDALAALQTNPELGDRKSLVVDLAYEEFCLRTEAGESLDAENFAGRFSRYQTSVRRRLEIHEFLGSLNLAGGFEGTTVWPVAGDDFAGFTLVEEIGRGAFARVFLATDPELGDREVVLKVAAIAEREARLLGKLKHKNIVTVHSIKYDHESGLSAICMAYHGRATLCDLLDRAVAEAHYPVSRDLIEEVSRCDNESVELSAFRRRWFPLSFEEQIVSIVAQLADALSYAHGRGIQHRDLKPSNVLLDWSGQPMLLDFNLSVDPAEAHRNLGGTLPYMAPELVRGLSGENSAAPTELGERADVFALGVLLCELLTGHVPFPPLSGSPASLEVVAQQHLENQRGGPRLPAKPLLQTDPRLWSLIERCVAFTPADRPESAAAVVRELRSYLGWRGRLRRAAQRHRKKLLYAVLTAVLFAGLVGAWLWSRPPYEVRAAAAGRDAYQQGDYKRSIELLTESLDAHPNDFDALVARGRAQQALGKFALALDDYFSASQLSSSAELHACMAFCLAKTQYFDSAVFHCEQAIKLGFENARLWHIRGYSAYRTTRKERALEFLGKAIELDPTFQQPWLTRAGVELNQAPGVPVEAMASVERALELGPETGRVHQFAAFVYAMAAKQDAQWAEAAIDHLDAALRFGLDPSVPTDHPSFRGLTSHPRFASLLGRRQASRDNYETESFLDPLDVGTLPKALLRAGE